MITEEHVGLWGARHVVFDGGEHRVPGRRWHYIESVVAGDIVSACGKQMPIDGIEPGVPIRANPAPVRSLRCQTCTRIVARRDANA